MTKRIVRVPKRILDRVIMRDEKMSACRGLYSLRSTAEYFGISHEQVRRIWARNLDTSNIDPPNIGGTKRQPALIEDSLILCQRGLSVREAADQLGVHQNYLRTLLSRTPRGLEVLDRDQSAREAWKRGRSNPRGSAGPSYRGEQHYSWANSI